MAFERDNKIIAFRRGAASLVKPGSEPFKLPGLQREPDERIRRLRLRRRRDQEEIDLIEQRAAGLRAIKCEQLFGRGDSGLTPAGNPSRDCRRVAFGGKQLAQIADGTMTEIALR